MAVTGGVTVKVISSGAAALTQDQFNVLLRAGIAANQDLVANVIVADFPPNPVDQQYEILGETSIAPGLNVYAAISDTWNVAVI